MAYTGNASSAFSAKPEAPVRQDAKASKGFRLSDLLPAVGATIGGIGGGAIGSFAGPGPGTLAGGVAGGAAGSALGELLRQKLTGESNGGEIAKQAAFGAGGELVGGALSLGSKVAARGAEEAASQLANRAVTTSPTAARNFKTLLGEYPGLFAAKNGLLGADEAAVNSTLKAGNEAYGKTLADTAGNVDKRQMGQAIRSKITDLATSTDPRQQALAGRLQTIFKNISDTAGTDPVALNAEKSHYADLVSRAERLGGDASNLSVDKSVSDVLRSTLNSASEAAGGTLKGQGKRLQGLEELRKLAAQRDAQGALLNPASLTKIVGTVGGIGAGGAQGSTPGEKLRNAILGGAAGFAGSNFLNTQAGQRVVAGGLSRLGANAERAAAPTLANAVVPRLLGQGASRIAGAVGSAATDNPQAQDGTQETATPYTFSPSSISDQGPSQQEKSQQIIQALLVSDLAKTGGKNLAKIQAVASLMGASAQSKAPTAAQSQAQGFADRLGQAEGIIGQNTPALQKLGTLGYSIQQRLPNFLKNDTVQTEKQAEDNFINAVLRRESGAAISSGEYATARSQYLPQPGDHPTTLANKARNRQAVYQSILREATAQPISAYQPVGAAFGQ